MNTSHFLPIVSVVIPIFNEEKPILSLLKSFEKQTSKNFQVICVDNNSSDNTILVIKKCQKRVYFPLHIVKENKPGPGNARKKGGEFVLNQLSNSNCHISENYIIATTDADCVVPPCWIQYIENIFTNNKKCGIAGGPHTGSLSIDDKIYKYTGIKNYFEKIAYINQFLATNSIGKIKLSGPNSAMRLIAYKKAHGFNQPLNSDGSIGIKELADLGKRIVQAGYGVSFIPCTVISSRRRHFEELIEGHDMYLLDKNDPGKRFVSIRDSETKLLDLALKIVPIRSWVNYQNLLIYKIIHNMIMKPLLENQLKFTDLTKLNLDKDKITNIKNKIMLAKVDLLNFYSLYPKIPEVYTIISVAIYKILTPLSHNLTQI